MGPTTDLPFHIPAGDDTRPSPSPVYGQQEVPQVCAMVDTADGREICVTSENMWNSARPLHNFETTSGAVISALNETPQHP